MTGFRPQLFLRVFAALFGLLALSLTTATAQVVLHRGNTADPGTLDPQKANGQWENHIISDMFVGLTTYDVKGESIYGAAESHTVSDDKLVWTFKIRQGHKWSDGTPVTAHDFVYAYRRINDPLTKAEYAAITYMIKNAEAVNTNKAELTAIGAKAIDGMTLEITLEHPAPYFFQALSHYAFYPVPKHVVE
jgi:oligopeptide transport system substrate-binding protein